MAEFHWGEYTQLRDTIYGYIKIPKPIVKGLIDLPEYQRLKDIQQTGMRVLYPSATHDRFTHSLGVYHLGRRSFEAFTNNLRHQRPLKDRGKTYYELVDEEKWARWGLLLQLACLLHDCGHAPFSHTLEFVYNLSVETDRQPRYIFSIETLVGYFSKETGHEEFISFLRALMEDDGPASPLKRDPNVKKPAPHELMSACYVTQEPFAGAIEALIRDYMASWRQSRGRQETEPEPIGEDLEFICRMILGTDYHPVPGSPLDSELQLRNCVIRLLNSELDADNLDYTMRDARFSGYESQQIDLERLQNALTVIPALEFDGKQVNLRLNNPIACKSFEGTAMTYLYGACSLYGEEGVAAEGNLQLLEGTDPLQQVKRKYLFTREEFSAWVESPRVRITGPYGEEARLFLRGRLEGTFTGTVYGRMEGEAPADARELILFAFNKSCLSVLESAVAARNYEYLWIYAHHTIAYETAFLQIYLIDRYASYLFHYHKNEHLRELMEKIKALSFPAGGGAGLTLPVGPPAEGTPRLFTEIFCEMVIPVANVDAARRILCFWRGEDCADPLPKGGVQALISRLTASAAALAKKHGRRITAYGLEAAEYLLEIGVRVLALYLESDPFEAEKSMEEWVELLEGKLSEAFALPESPASGLQDWREQREALDRLFHRVRYEETAIMVDLMSVREPQREAVTWFYRSTDHDLLCRYKSLYYQLEREREQHRLEPGKEEFWRVLREYISRQYPACAWKTYAEYKHQFRHWGARELGKLRYCLQERGSGMPGDDRARLWVMDENIRKHLVKAPGITDSEKRIWEVFRGAGITRVVWIEHKIKIKHLHPDKTFIRLKDSALRLRDVELGAPEPADREFAFLFYEMEEPGRELDPNGLETMLTNLRECVKTLPTPPEWKNEKIPLPGGPEGAVRNMLTEQDAVIRDVVHGDILIPRRFMRLVDTREFQRLRRIRQLATSYLIFPGADHTRFAHSVGCFAVMQKLTLHFKAQFSLTGIKIPEEEWDALLCAALLHDLGHGPLSHAFERAASTPFRHEDWTLRLIREDSTQTNRALREFYGPGSPKNQGFVERVCRYIEKRIDHKTPSRGEKAPLPLERPAEIHDLTFVFASLVSSQLDADRMDYLLRDAYHTGYRFGNVDVDKIIGGMQLTVAPDGRFDLCCLMNSLPFVEDYLLARFQMYKNVYMENYKIYTEQLFQRLLERAKYLCVKADGKPLRSLTPVALRNVFDGSEMSCDLYLKLDDGLVMGAIANWTEFPGDRVLSELCRSFLDRDGFMKLNLMENTENDYNDYRAQLSAVLGQNGYALTPGEERWFLIEAKVGYELYNPGKEAIRVLTNDGKICELSQVSVLLKGLMGKKQEKRTYYLNEAILAWLVAKQAESRNPNWKEEVRRLNKSFENRSHIEIEQKYRVRDDKIFGRLREAFGLTEGGEADPLFGEYGFAPAGESDQEDTYYDFADEAGGPTLAPAGRSVRIREKGDRYKLTVKLSAQSEGGPSEGQSNRFEYELELKGPALDGACRSYIKKQFERRGQGTDALERLEPWLRVKNRRQIINITSPGNGFLCEMVLDTVTFRDPRTGRESAPWYQIEIELKSDYLYRPNLALFCGRLQQAAEGWGLELTKTTDSKYLCGLRLLGILG